MKRIFSLLLMVLAGFLAAQSSGDEELKDAPDFTLLDITGEPVSLYALLENGPVYMECWDLPCVNCIAELDALMPIYDSLAEQGLQIVALSVDKPADEAKVKAFVKSKKWPYICLLDQQHEVMNEYGIVIKPTAFLINQDAKIVYTHIGYKKGDEQRIKEEFLKVLPARSSEPEGEEDE